MKKLIFKILLITLILAIAALACVGGGDRTTAKGGALNGESSAFPKGPDVTATYGAEQFHLQLTAVAQPVP
jgi:hypothetical protein